MASNTCKSCLRALRCQTRSIGQSTQFSHQLTSSRPFTTFPNHRMELPKPNATAANPIPPVSPIRAPLNKENKQLDPNHPHAAAQKRKESWSYAHPYSAYGLTAELYKQCSKHANYSIPEASDENVEMPRTASGEDLGKAVDQSWWLDPKGAGLQPTFSTWSQITMLHMWLFTVRFRATGPDVEGKRSAKEVAHEFQQHLLDHFFYDAEDKMAVYHNMSAAGTRNKYLNDLHVQWRGCLAAYDEALINGDAVLAAAVWRNVFKASEEVDLRTLAMIVSFLRRTLRGLGGITDEKLNGSLVEFGSPAAEASVVGAKSASMDAPIVQEKVEKKP